MEHFKSILYAGLSGGGVVTSFFVATLPIIQWFAALVAAVSGCVGICWVAVQYRRGRRS